MIRVLIVESSPLTANLIAAILNSDSQIEVAGIVKDGLEAVRMTSKLKPDLITLDIHMPGMDGLEATKQIMAYTPVPILILTSSVSRQEGSKVFKAISYGAIDVMEKLLFEGDTVNQEVKSELIAKIKFLSKIRVIRHPLAKFEQWKIAPFEQWGIAPSNLEAIPAMGQEKIVGIVAWAGGPQTLLRILMALPKEFPAPIVIVQHISPGFVTGLVEWLDHQTSLKVSIAENDETLNPGTGYIAPKALHLRVTRAGKIALDNEPAVSGQRPSGTVLLQSIAKAYGKRGLGVLLTGMGRDGADGLEAIHKARGHTVAQDEQSAVVYGMPKAAIDLGVVDEVLPLTDIAAKMMEWVSGP